MPITLFRILPSPSSYHYPLSFLLLPLVTIIKYFPRYIFSRKFCSHHYDPSPSTVSSQPHFTYDFSWSSYIFLQKRPLNTDTIPRLLRAYYPTVLQHTSFRTLLLLYKYFSEVLSLTAGVLAADLSKPTTNSFLASHSSSASPSTCVLWSNF